MKVNDTKMETITGKESMTKTGVDSEELKENADSYLKLEVPPYDVSQSAIDTIAYVYPLNELLEMLPKYILDKRDKGRTTFSLDKNMNGEYKGGWWNLQGFGPYPSPSEVVIKALIYLNTLSKDKDYEAIY